MRIGGRGKTGERVGQGGWCERRGSWEGRRSRKGEGHTGKGRKGKEGERKEEERKGSERKVGVQTIQNRV